MFITSSLQALGCDRKSKWFDYVMIIIIIIVIVIVIGCSSSSTVIMYTYIYIYIMKLVMMIAIAQHSLGHVCMYVYILRVRTHTRCDLVKPLA